MLLRLSGQAPRIRGMYFTLWSTVALWKPESRYNSVGLVLKDDAESMILAVEQLLKVL